MTNDRLATVAAVLIALALTPTVMHSYLGLRTDDGYTAAVPTTLAGLTSRPSDRQAAWVLRTLDSSHCSERHYRKPAGGDITLFIARSYDGKRLYHHPELAIAYGHDLRDGGTVRLQTPADMTVRVLRGPTELGTGLAVYALLYEREFIDNPYVFELRRAGALLFSPRQPLTLFFAHDREAPSDAAVEEALATRVLVAAAQSFLAQAPAQ